MLLYEQQTTKINGWRKGARDRLESTEASLHLLSIFQHVLSLVTPLAHY